MKLELLANACIYNVMKNYTHLLVDSHVCTNITFHFQLCKYKATGTSWLEGLRNISPSLGWDSTVFAQIFTLYTIQWCLTFFYKHNATIATYLAHHATENILYAFRTYWIKHTVCTFDVQMIFVFLCLATIWENESGWDVGLARLTRAV